MDGAYGNQANDRRHVIKFFGNYNVTDAISVGWNSTLASGKPKSSFGQSYPSTNPDLFGGYGDTFYITNADGSFTKFPRGSQGFTSWTFNLDLSVSYSFAMNGIDMKATLDVFNVLDNQTPTRLNEHYEVSLGQVNQYYGAAYDWQTPRYVRIGFSARF